MIKWIFKSAEDKAAPGKANRNAFVLLVVFCALIGVVEYARAFDNDVPVYFNSEKAPADITEAIEYVSWSWSQRTGKNFNYAGNTSSQTMQGAAIVRYENNAHFKRMGLASNAAYARQWSWDDGSFYSFEIVLNSDHYQNMSVVNMRTLIHEFGHLIDIQHSADNHSVMSGVTLSEPPRYALPMVDYGSFQGSQCHAELTREFDIYIPDIQGQRVSLVYQGDETWKLSTLSENVATIGCDSTEYQASTGALVIRDLRGFGVGYSAELVQITDDTFRLKFAE